VPFTLHVLENIGQETNYKYKFDSTIQLFTDKYNSETANNTKHSKNKTILVQSPFTTLGCSNSFSKEVRPDRDATVVLL